MKRGPNIPVEQRDEWARNAAEIASQGSKRSSGLTIKEINRRARYPGVLHRRRLRACWATLSAQVIRHIETGCRPPACAPHFFAAGKSVFQASSAPGSRPDLGH